ncbi:Bgt-5331 [Blumeria graminis f. sp. tritici]|uniref:rRNA biogenesis protein RRP36 n=2 Tax=Blumeria graminis f. sp. tritici TaxID=62690 RepID=A0A061HP75_BLUGR|nr:hypothetical protein BGT96224_5331 [Blumeria graminis f. sp. tritici 96224]VDB86191.1 Bgt-5331 [Blumeria graminis f. sp. tritici]
MLLKRRTGDAKYQRRIRAQREASEEIDVSVSIPSDGQTDASVDDSSESEVDTGDARALPIGAASISFGALVEAQASFPSILKDKKTTKASNKQSDHEEEVRRGTSEKSHQAELSRPNKHAPTEVSSKKAVTRRRDVVATAYRKPRDPRFELISGPVDRSRVNAAYSFLDTYREDEINELKTAIKATKDLEKKEELKKTLMAMESRQKANMKKLKEQEVVDRHKKEEKALVKQGKQPYYLKKSEQKKQILLDRFAGLKGKQLDRVIERRRKKVDGREKKKMPFSRRQAE